MKTTCRDVCFALCAFAYVFLGAGLQLLDLMEHSVIETEIQQDTTAIHRELPLPEIPRFVIEEEEYLAHLDETPEFSAVMYATEYIGRYYITAYNHLETGSRQTASGATCHEGTITTCAADSRYHKFGEYLEIDGRLYRVEDTGSAVKKRHIDLYFASYKEMARYNSNYQNIYRVTFPFGKPKD